MWNPTSQNVKFNTAELMKMKILYLKIVQLFSSVILTETYIISENNLNDIFNKQISQIF